MTSYEEKVSSKRTEALFLALTLLFLRLWLQRAGRGGRCDRLRVGLASASAFFLFYALNYRTLIIQLTSETVTLRFGLFTWKVAIDNVDRCFLDKTSLWRIGGAGIHFSPIKGRYRAMFNFLEYPRVVMALQQKQGPVSEIAFSTQQPGQVLDFIRT